MPVANLHDATRSRLDAPIHRSLQFSGLVEVVYARPAQMPSSAVPEARLLCMTAPHLRTCDDPPSPIAAGTQPCGTDSQQTVTKTLKGANRPSSAD